MDYIKSLEKRYSAKKFTAEKVPSEVVSRILNAGRLSASSLGLQPYKIYVLESKEALEKVEPAFFNPSQVKSCSHLFVITAKKDIEDHYIEGYLKHITQVREQSIESLEGFKTSIQGFRTKIGTERLWDWSKNQTYIVLGHLLFAAALENIDSSPMEGFDDKILTNALPIDPAKEWPSVTLALGYRSPEDPFQSLKKVRKPEEKLIEFL